MKNNKITTLHFTFLSLCTLLLITCSSRCMQMTGLDQELYSKPLTHFCKSCRQELSPSFKGDFIKQLDTLNKSFEEDSPEDFERSAGGVAQFFKQQEVRLETTSSQAHEKYKELLSTVYKEIIFNKFGALNEDINQSMNCSAPNKRCLLGVCTLANLVGGVACIAVGAPSIGIACNAHSGMGICGAVTATTIGGGQILLGGAGFTITQQNRCLNDRSVLLERKINLLQKAFDTVIEIPSTDSFNI